MDVSEPEYDSNDQELLIKRHKLRKKPLKPDFAKTLKF